MLNDSPRIVADLELVEGKIVRFWQVRITTREFVLSDLRELSDDLVLLDVSRQGRDYIETLLKLHTIEPSRLVQEEETRSKLLALVRTRRPDFSKSMAPLRQSIETQVFSQVLAALRQQLQDANATYMALSFGEELITVTQDRSENLRQIVAQGHLARADRFAGSGRSAVLALIHLDRAQQLGLALPTSSAGSVKDVAIASFASAGRLPLRMRVDSNPSNEPILQDLARFAVTRSISRRVRSHINLQSFGPYEKTVDLEISIDFVRLFVPSLNDLKTVSSSYLSHFEDIANPAKRSLKTQLDFQRSSIDFGLSSLNSAIGMFNINPTEWTLQSMNTARTRYNQEIDTYNLLVQQYNLTSATISRPVYLSYIFREGRVRHGWQLSGSVAAAGKTERFEVEELDSAFVRIGTRPADRNVSYRRDDLLDIPVGTARLIEQLTKAAEKVYERIGTVAQGLPIYVRNDLTEAEQRLVAAALYPFGGTGSHPGTSIAWADNTIRRLTLPEIGERSVPAVKITRPKVRPRETSPEAIAAFYVSAVALISSKDGRTGAGAVISDDGLVLTAAHVIGQEPIEVSFPRSGNSRRHHANLIFVNEKHDVALLRLTDYRPDRWLEVALSESPSPGEPIAAIGNPSIGKAGQAAGAISRGIVATAYDSTTSDGLGEMVADIAVASGSSGGPLISLRTGKVVGVVTAVVAPSISKDFASSGYWAVAAPSSEFGKWLGIVYGP
jgi:S1-C subfamily serine protease